MRRLRAALLLAATLAAAPAAAQESRLEADLRLEREDIAKSCTGFAVNELGGCAYTLATDSPFHIALGSLAPQNGFAFGLAFDEHVTPNESWRISWNADAVRALGGSWRAGAYAKFVHTPATSGVVVLRPGTAPSGRTIAPRELPVFDLFVQDISLETVHYYGPDATAASVPKTTFGEGEMIVGGSVAYPVGALDALRPALIGAVAGRFIDIRSQSKDGPAIGDVYSDPSAPGLADQPGFLQVREGVRIRPAPFNSALRMNYLFAADQFRAGSGSHLSFNRWTLDLAHEIPLYRNVSSTGPRAFNGPDSCAEGTGAGAKCPPLQWSRNREGTVRARLLFVKSTTPSDNRVPFYLQPTLGGSDINGERMLASFDDYRFRGPNLLLLQESVEHSISGPFGAYVLFEQGNVSALGSTPGFGDLRTSTTVGLTLRAGGFPMVNLSFSWGGGSHHTIAAMDTTLLGGSSRPSLY